MAQRRKSSPKGVSRRPIALRLTPDELDDIKVHEKEFSITKSAFAREAYLKGKSLLLNELRQQG